MTSLLRAPLFRKTLALATLAVAMAVPARAADSTITKTHYSITFHEGWMTNPYLPSTDSTFWIMDTSSETVVIGNFTSTGGTLGMNYWRQVWSQMYAQAFTLADSGTKTLGANSFFWTEWMDTTDGGADSSRGRFYITSQGTAIMVFWMAFNGDGADAVAAMEAALATFQFIDVPNSIRRLDRRQAYGLSADRRDLLGRSWQPVTYRLPRVPLYQRPR